MSSAVERANAIRVLAMDAVQRANSGHPGAPMGMADFAEVLWREVLRHDPANPDWINRDRVVLSNGHASMLLYSALHLSGYDVGTEDLKAFRQLDSKTAGHPEYGHCPGVETTTGPLGQGFANAVGMALAEQRLGEEFNTDDFKVIDHRTIVIVGDGCLMEGISHEAASLAGTLGLGKLVCLYDDNGISIDGEVGEWFGEDVPGRFEAYGWRVIRNVDGHDRDDIAEALENATDSSGQPTLVCLRTTIGYGSPAKAGTADAHGAPLGDEEIAVVRGELNWGSEPFEIPEHVREAWDCRARGATLSGDWQALFERYQAAHPDKASELLRRMAGELPAGWADELNALAADAQASGGSLATRKSSQACIGAVANALPELFGGSADLTGSNGTRWSGAEPSRYMSYGVREFGMTAICNGIALHGGFIPFSGTFLVFMEYARNAVRLASLMGIRNILVYTHDSVAVGEDGPTHQPVEQLTNLRTTPGLATWRPCDTVESAVAWRCAIERNGPSALIFTRQGLPCQPKNAQQIDDIARGGYVLVKEQGELASIIIATGSEVELAVQAAAQLNVAGKGTRVVSMPSAETFLAQDAEYREAVLPAAMRARVAVEAAHGDYWYRFVGLDGAVVSIDRYGVSAPGNEALATLGMTVDSVLAAVHRVTA
ncbi:MAG: transketolase [Pseudomonadaceae bacterium]|nr:transketolase [Pseudomonadaceae bacterium]